MSYPRQRRARAVQVPPGFYILNRTLGTCAMSLPAGTKLNKALASGLCISCGEREHLIEVVEVYKVDGRAQCRAWKSFKNGKGVRVPT